MDLECYPPEVRKYITALIRLNVMNSDSLLKDKTFLNYLHTQRFDEDYIESMLRDRGLSK